MQLIAINAQGLPETALAEWPPFAQEVMQATANLYQVSGYQPPWIGYLAIVEGNCVGTCAFKTPPQDNQVEIAYFTFPDHEGRGFATSMARQLIQIAHDRDPSLMITAQTLPTENASTRILQKLGFVWVEERTHPEDGLVWHWQLSRLIAS